MYKYDELVPVLGKPVDSSWNKLIENDKGALSKVFCMKMNVSLHF